MTEAAVRVVAARPTPGTPRPYDFPEVERSRLGNGLSLAVVNLPGRPLVSAMLVLRNGAGDEPDGEAGATVLAARALTEGTERYDAIALVEAGERLGAAIHADAGWDAMTIGVDVPATRLEPALDLLAEVALHPTFPTPEVDRLRDERLNDLLQAEADPRRRADEAYAATIYSGGSPYRRPSGGTKETVERLGPSQLRAAYERGLDPARATLIVGGDLAGIDVPAIAERLFGSWGSSFGAGPTGLIVAEGAVRDRFVRVLHRPGSVQTEIRIGHIGLPRQIPDFHALSVMGAILGGLFNSRLNTKLREEKGYTYGAGAGFDLRRAAGPFAARAAVNTEVTVPAIIDIMAELDRIRDTPVTEAELKGARDFLVGVFPLRFEVPGPVVGALAGLVIHELPDDELSRYRAAIEAVTVEAVQKAARDHIRPDASAIVLVGDADAFGAELEAAGLGRLVIEREAGPQDEGRDEGVQEALGPVDEGSGGPTEGGEEPAAGTIVVPEGTEDGSAPTPG
ncbi:MAG TPA: pitrilysin family protein [Candidatus Limnocylindrales bacterium]|nr:pitrilysin family protein [Candidatus Limnocylindrales bacterium]